MTRVLTTAPALVLAIVCCAADPVPPPVDAVPQPPKIAYHRFGIILGGEKPKHTLETMRKFLAPFDVVQMKVLETLPPARQQAMGAGVIRRKYSMYIRSDQTYERVMADLMRKPGIRQVCEYPACCGRTIYTFPQPIIRTAIPGNGKYGRPRKMKKKAPDSVVPNRD